PGCACHTRHRVRRCVGRLRDSARCDPANDRRGRPLDHDQDPWDGLAPRSGRSFGLAARVHRPVALVEVLRAERADVPLRSDELAAVWTNSLEPGAAGRAEDEFFLHAFLARRAHDALLRFCEEALLRELTLVRLAEGLFGTDDEIQEEAEDVED